MTRTGCRAAESQWGTRLPGGGLLLAPGGAQMYLSSEIVAGTVGRIVMAFVMRGAFTLSGDPDPPDPPHPFTGCWPLRPLAARTLLPARLAGREAANARAL